MVGVLTNVVHRWRTLESVSGASVAIRACLCQQTRVEGQKKGAHSSGLEKKKESRKQVGTLLASVLQQNNIEYRNKVGWRISRGQKWL